MKSLWFKYLAECGGDQAIEHDWGFVTYRFVDKSVYMPEIYIVPDKRRAGLATILVSEVEDIARKHKAEKLLGSVCMALPEHIRIASIKGHLSLGFVPVMAEHGKIWFSRDIDYTSGGING